MLNLIPCGFDITFTKNVYTKILKYGIELLPAGKKFCFDSLDDENFTISYVIDKIINSPSGHQLPIHFKKCLDHSYQWRRPHHNPRRNL